MIKQLGFLPVISLLALSMVASPVFSGPKKNPFYSKKKIVNRLGSQPSRVNPFGSGFVLSTWVSGQDRQDISLDLMRIYNNAVVTRRQLIAARDELRTVYPNRFSGIDARFVTEMERLDRGPLLAAYQVDSEINGSNQSTEQLQEARGNNGADLRMSNSVLFISDALTNRNIRSLEEREYEEQHRLEMLKNPGLASYKYTVTRLRPTEEERQLEMKKKLGWYLPREEHEDMHKKLNKRDDKDDPEGDIGGLGGGSQIGLSARSKEISKLPRGSRGGTLGKPVTTQTQNKNLTAGSFNATVEGPPYVEDLPEADVPYRAYAMGALKFTDLSKIGHAPLNLTSYGPLTAHGRAQWAGQQAEEQAARQIIRDHHVRSLNSSDPFKFASGQDPAAIPLHIHTS